MFSYVDEEIDEAISKYDAGNTELIIFGKRVYLNPDLVARATNIPCIGGAILCWRHSPPYTLFLVKLAYLNHYPKYY